MFAVGIALESVIKLFSNGMTSQKFREHTDGHFNYQTGICKRRYKLMPHFGRLHYIIYAGWTTLND